MSCCICLLFCCFLMQAVSGGGTDSQVLDLSNRFYTLIPHDFGMKKPPLLNNLDYIKVLMGKQLTPTARCSFEHMTVNNRNCLNYIPPLSRDYIWRVLKIEIKTIDFSKQGWRRNGQSIELDPKNPDSYLCSAMKLIVYPYPATTSLFSL